MGNRKMTEVTVDGKTYRSRMAAAKYLLETTDLNNTEIGKKVGMSSQTVYTLTPVGKTNQLIRQRKKSPGMISEITGLKISEIVKMAKEKGIKLPTKEEINKAKKSKEAKKKTKKVSKKTKVNAKAVEKANENVEPKSEEITETTENVNA